MWWWKGGREGEESCSGGNEWCLNSKGFVCEETNSGTSSAQTREARVLISLAASLRIGLMWEFNTSSSSLSGPSCHGAKLALVQGKDGDPQTAWR